MTVQRNKTRQLTPHETPFEGLSNTHKRMDTGAPHDINEQNMDNNRWVMGVQSRAKEFQPFFRYGGSTRGGTTTSVDDHNVCTNSKDVRQPKTLAYRMESQGVKFGKVK